MVSLLLAPVTVQGAQAGRLSSARSWKRCSVHAHLSLLHGDLWRSWQRKGKGMFFQFLPSWQMKAGCGRMLNRAVLEVHCPEMTEKELAPSGSCAAAAVQAFGHTGCEAYL